MNNTAVDDFRLGKIYTSERYENEAYRKYAQRWVRFQRLGPNWIDPKGLHVFMWNRGVFDLENLPAKSQPRNFSITYSTPGKDGTTSWERRFEFALIDPKTKDRFELDLIFWIKFLQGSFPDQFRVFCYFAPLFDTVAESLEYCSYLHSPSMQNRFI